MVQQRAVDRKVRHMESLPEGYRLTDITSEFVISDKTGLKPHKRAKFRLAYVGKQKVDCGVLMAIGRAIEEGWKGFMIVAEDRVTKELVYVCL